MTRCHLILIKEVIKTTTLRVTQKLWLHVLVVTFIALPIVSVVGQSASAGYVPTRTDDAGQSSDSSRSRAGSTR